jgi:4-alpha-glucanotransferase
MELIEQLAEIVGFHASYTGTFGDKVFANIETKRSLLKAMGYSLDEVSLTRTIDDLKNSQWLNILPPVHIAKLEDQEHSIPISLPDTESTSVKWKVTTECGDTIESSVNINELTYIDEKFIGESRYIHFRLKLPVLVQGYHQLTIICTNHEAKCPLIYAPEICFSAKEAHVNKVWGYTAQLYSLRSKSNWGIGDFSDLLQLIEKANESEASLIGLNPLHPLYQQNPAHRSPYSPSSRSFLNCLYIDVTKAPNFKTCELAQVKMRDPFFQQAISSANETKLVDYTAVAKLKYEITEILFADFNQNVNDIHQQMLEDFNNFKLNNGEVLYSFATFEAINEHINLSQENAYGWLDWPSEYQDPNSDAVKEFQEGHETRINYFCFIQWLAHQQIIKVSDRCNEIGMPIGLYLDLAVGCDGSGVDVWSNQNVYVGGASIGAPPDDMNPLGQNWGLTPMNPIALKQQGYQPLIKALRASMQYAGALRIDHILGLMRQYWVAPGLEANEGVYISFPFDDILRIIALESRRNNCVVIGEDLGNVPEGFSDKIQQSGLLSFKVMFFERWDSGLFKRPEHFPEKSVVTIATHDTATLTGWWQGVDLAWRQQLNLYPNEDAGHADRNSRPGERANLISALEDLQVINIGNAPQESPPIMNTELSTSVQHYLANSHSHIQLIPLEDALELPEQVNIPGTIDEHPNWLQKLPVTLEEMWQVNSVKAIIQTMNTARPK